MWGLPGAVLVVQSDSSRKEGPAIPLLHTLGVYYSIAEGAAQCRDSVLQGVGLLHQQWWPSSRSLPPPALGQQGIPGWNWPSWYVYQISSYLLPRWCCSSRLLHRKWLMPPQSHRNKSGVPPALQRTWANSTDGVCSDLSHMSLQCDQSSPANCSGALPGTRKMSPSQCPFPGCSPVCRVVCACENPPPVYNWLNWNFSPSSHFNASIDTNIFL